MNEHSKARRDEAADDSGSPERDAVRRALPTVAKAARTGLADEGMARYGSLGIQFAGTMLVLGALGYWADQALGTLPWLLIAGILLGAVGGFISLVKKVPPARGSAKKTNDSA